jgi:hypothetical protein
VSTLTIRPRPHRRDPLAQTRHAHADVLPSLFDVLGGEPTLDDVVVGAWEGLTAHMTATCPVCEGEMKPEYGAHALPLGGRCETCGSALS